MTPEQSRQQVANLILPSPNMVACSDLVNDHGTSKFAVMDTETGFRYHVSVRVEEIGFNPPTTEIDHE